MCQCGYINGDAACLIEEETFLLFQVCILINHYPGVPEERHTHTKKIKGRNYYEKCEPYTMFLIKPVIIISYIFGLWSTFC